MSWPVMTGPVKVSLSGDLQTWLTERLERHHIDGGELTSQFVTNLYDEFKRTHINRQVKRKEFVSFIQAWWEAKEAETAGAS